MSARIVDKSQVNGLANALRVDNGTRLKKSEYHQIQERWLPVLQHKP